MSDCEVMLLSSDEDDAPVTVKKKSPAKRLDDYRLTSSDDDSVPLVRVSVSKTSEPSTSAGKADTQSPSSSGSGLKRPTENPFLALSDSEDEFDKILFGERKKSSPRDSFPKDPSPRGYSPLHSYHRHTPELDSMDELENEPESDTEALRPRVPMSRHLHPMSDSDSESDDPPPAQRVPMASTSKENGVAKSPAKKARRGKYTEEEKAAMEAEKREKRRKREEMRRKRPENCLKFIIMEVDRSLVDIQALQAVLLAPPINVIRHEVKDRDVPLSVCWHRELMPDENGDCKREPATSMMQLLEMEMIEPLVRSRQLVNHITEIIKKDMSMERYTMVVFGSKQYFAAKRKRNDGRISKTELEESIVECQIELGVSFRLLENAQEVCEWLYRYTKAVAEEPFKVMKNSWQENFRFHLESEKGTNIREGLPTVWLKVLNKFRRAPVECCQAIAEAYPTPASLVKAYEDCETIDDAKYLLENISVMKGIGPLAVQRRVGPAMSRRLHAVLTSVHPDLLLSELE